MTPLPIHLQGFLHIIGIALSDEIQPSAYISYLRPRITNIQINQTDNIDCNQILPQTDENFDVVDKMILDAIKQKLPSVSNIIKYAICEEWLEDDTVDFNTWYENPIYIIPSVNFKPYYPNTPNAFKARTQEIPMTLYVSRPPEEIMRENKNASLFDSYNRWDCRDERFYNLVLKRLKERPVYDLKSVLKEIRNNQ